MEKSKMLKITITAQCGAKCVTCPRWRHPGGTMPVGMFRDIMQKVIDLKGLINPVFVNSTGDYSDLGVQQAAEYTRILEEVNRKGIRVIVTTNSGTLLVPFPNVWKVVFSFNGTNPEDFRHNTGLDFDIVRGNIRFTYNILRDRKMLRCYGGDELHTLLWKGDRGTEADVLALWKDFPGRVRVSYKYDNQFQEDQSVVPRKEKRVPCDYLDMIVVNEQGKIIRCSHDFSGITAEDSFLCLSWPFSTPYRSVCRRWHEEGRFAGLCESCNYNVESPGLVRYLK